MVGHGISHYPVVGDGMGVAYKFRSKWRFICLPPGVTAQDIR